jgi:hypothetical protein
MRLTGFEPATFRVGELRHTMKKGLMTGFLVVMDQNRRGDEEGTNCAAAGIWRDCSDGGQVVVSPKGYQVIAIKLKIDYSFLLFSPEFR